MTPEVTVLIPTIPERGHLFQEALASVCAQATPSLRWLIGSDEQHNGPIATVNALAACVETEWLFRLDDDDVLDPDHFRVLSPWLDGDADIVYTWCRVEDGGDEHPEDQFQVRWQAEFGWEYLRDANFIPASAAIRTELWHDLGGYRPSEWTRHEDWDFWVRALDAGARFRCVPAVTWTYRMTSDWEHRLCESSS